MWVSQCVGGGRSDSYCEVDEGGFTTVVLYAKKRRRFDAVKKKKKNLIEPGGLEGTNLFVRFTGWTADSSGLIPVQSNSGPIDWNCDQLTIGPVGPVRFLKP